MKIVPTRAHAMMVLQAFALVTAFAGGCGGVAAPHVHAPARPQQRRVTANASSTRTPTAPAEAPHASRPHFSAHTNARAVALSTLHYAIPTVIRAHPSGDVVLAGCTEGPTDLFPAAAEGRVLAFVTRMDPRSGAIRWSRHWDIGAESFENGCRTLRPVGDRAAGLVGTTQVVVDDDGAIHVTSLIAANASHDSIAGAPTPGPVVMALDPADGTTRWEHSIAGPADAVAVTHLIADRTGAVAVVRRASPDGLDTYSLLRCDGDGRVAESQLFRAAPAPGRRTQCHPGARGCRIAVDYVSHDDDGSLAIHGTLAGVELSIGAMSIRSSPDGDLSDGFWAVVERDGTLRSLRGRGPVLTTVVRANAHHVVAAVHPPSHAERVELIDPATGAGRPWSAGSAADPTSPIARTLQLFEDFRRRVDEASITNRAVTSALVLPASVPLTADGLRHVAESDPQSPAPQQARLVDGSVAAIVTLHGTLRVSGETTSSTHRMVRCHPGRAGEEVSQSPDCREPLERPSAVLLVWPSTP